MPLGFWRYSWREFCFTEPGCLMMSATRGLGAGRHVAGSFRSLGSSMHNRSYRLLVALALPVAFVASTGVAQAEQITFANNAGQSGGTFTIGNTVQISGGRISAVAVTGGAAAAVSGACGTWGCLELVTGAYIGPDAARRRTTTSTRAPAARSRLPGRQPERARLARCTRAAMTPAATSG